MKALDLTGKVFGRLTVLHLGTSKGNFRRWVCKCICGSVTEVMVSSLTCGHTQSCGCLQKEAAAAGAVKHGYARTGGKSAEYTAWVNIKTRCYNSNTECFKHYGGKGIRVCQRWLDSYENFLADMGTKPTPLHTIERRENGKDYGPDNCYWATRAEQSLNISTNVRITYEGVTKTMKEWADHFGLKPSRMRYLVNKNLRKYENY